MSKDIKKQIEQLREQIREHDYSYYVLAQPKISDQEYDKLFAELKELEKEHPELITEDSPTQCKQLISKIESLREQIREHDYLYYTLFNPKISDREYDKLFAELKQLEEEYPIFITEDSPTQRVSGQPLEGFETVTHSVPMLSMDNTYNAEELKAFDERIKKQLGHNDYDYVVELKIDGVAINLRYENGKLKNGATRGNGNVGEDVTKNIRTIKAIPLVLRSNEIIPYILEVRGEVYMPTSSFVELNRLQPEGESGFANPRNTAAGSLHLFDARTAAQRNLSFFAYATGEISEPLADNHYDCLKKLKRLGLPVNPNIQKAKDIEGVIKICLIWDKKRSELDYQIDGMVVKINNLAQREILGSTGRAPRWCISYKFAAEQAETKVESIDVQVGKSGILTPVANLTPVLLAGTTVKRASLHNFDMLAKLDVREGDTVIIEKAGEIIPQVVKVKIEKRKVTVGEGVTPPTICPICKHKVKKDDNGAYVRCDNLNCSAKLKERIGYFVGRGQMDIENLGPAIIEQLVDNNKVKDFSDLYKLCLFDLTQLDRMGVKSAENILEALDKSKTPPLWRFIAALGIPNVGGQTAQVLADKYDSIDDLMKAQKEELKKIPEIGTGLAKSIYDFFHDNENIEIINKLVPKYVNPQKQLNKDSHTLSKMTIVITGTLKNFTRQQIEQTIKENGGKSSSIVSKNTSFVLAGENPGSKIKKAQELGIRIIDEKQFLELIQNN